MVFDDPAAQLAAEPMAARVVAPQVEDLPNPFARFVRRYHSRINRRPQAPARARAADDRLAESPRLERPVLDSPSGTARQHDHSVRRPPPCNARSLRVA